MGTARNLLFKFLGDSKSLERASQRSARSLGKVDKQVQGTSRTIGGLKAKTAAIGLGVGAVATKLLQFGRDSTRMASDYKESINAVEVSTGDAADEIFALGETAAKSLGLSMTAVNDAAVAFAAFGEKIDADDVGGVFETYITRATDFASVMNLEVSDALLKFQSGLAGESEPLRKFGLDMSAAATAAFAYANGIADSGAKLSEAEKVQARYGLLLEQTDKFAGDFAATSGEVANQQRIVNAEMENSRIILGQELIPLQEKWNELLGSTASALATTTPAIGAAASGAANLAGDLVEVVDAGAGAAAAVAEFAESSQKAGDTSWFLSQALSAADVVGRQLGRNIISGPREAVLGLRDATISLNEWLSAADEDAERLGETFAAAGGQTVIYDKHIEDVTGRLQGVEEATDGAADATANLADEMLALVSPVFAAKKAEDAYKKVLREVTEDQVLTADEADELALAHLRMKAAADKVTPEAMTAYKDEVKRTRDAVVPNIAAIASSLHNIGSKSNLARAEAHLDRLERLTGRRIEVDLSSLRVATRADLQQAVTRELFALQRRGFRLIPV